jgi:hypothetical protein
MNKSVRVFSILILLVGFVSLTQSQDTKEVQKSGRFEPNGRVYVDTYKGSIDVRSWDKSEIEVRALIESDGDDRRSRERVQDTEIHIDLSSNSARIKTDYEKAKRHRGGFLGIFNVDSDNLPIVRYTISIPRSTSVVIKDYKSQTTIDDLQSDVDIDTYKGEVEVGRLSGSLNLNMYKGEARIEFANLKGRTRVETYKGEITVTLPRSQGFDLEAEVGKHASFRSDVELERDRRGDRHSGYDVRTSVNGGGPLLRLNSDHGTLRLLEL